MSSEAVYYQTTLGYVLCNMQQEAETQSSIAASQLQGHRFDPGSPLCSCGFPLIWVHWALHFPPTSLKHSSRLIGRSKLCRGVNKCVNVFVRRGWQIDRFCLLTGTNNQLLELCFSRLRPLWEQLTLYITRAASRGEMKTITDKCNCYLKCHIQIELKSISFLL